MQNKLMIRLRQNQVSIDYMRENIALKFDGMPKEDFKIIDFLDIKRNKYYISTYGRVFTIYGKELKQEESHVNNNVTYYRILLQCDKELSDGITEKRYLVHRLVAFAFIPKTEDDIVKNRDFVNHRYNTDGRCNFVWNLEWATNSENVSRVFFQLGRKRVEEERRTRIAALVHHDADHAGGVSLHRLRIERGTVVQFPDLFKDPLFHRQADLPLAAERVGYRARRYPRGSRHIHDCRRLFAHPDILS